jgi:hypothetical protein
LLARAAERPILGWGGWGRARIYDPVTGEDLSVTDGRWVIVIGQHGWVGYAAEFGLLALPVLLLLRRRGDGVQASAALAMILAVNLLDLLPNATLTPLTWLVSGALLGFAEQRAPMRAPAAARRSSVRRGRRLAVTHAES